MNREELVATVKESNRVWALALRDLAVFDAKAENNVFATLSDAIGEIEYKLGTEAADDCAGSGNCGAEEYTQAFMVEGVKYLGILTVQYDRHDKQYYYIDCSDFTYKVMENQK